MPRPWRASDPRAPLGGELFPRIGGVEVVVDGLVRALPPLGIELRVIAPAEDGTPAEELHAGVPVHRFPFGEALTHRDVRSIARIRRRIAEITEALPPTWPTCTRFIRDSCSTSRHRRPAWRDGSSPSTGGRGSRTAPRRLPAKLLVRADRITSCSAAVLALARQRIPAIRPVSSVIPNGVPPVQEMPTPLPFDPPRILCLGRLVAEKGFDLAVAAVAALSDRTPRPELVVAGDGPERAALEAAVAAEGLAGRTEFTGWVAPAAVPALVNRCTLVVVPSREEPFGLVAVQAGLMARPVVAAAVGGLPEVVRHGRTGLLVPGDDRGALTSAIRDVLDHPDLARRLGAAGRRRAHRSLGWPARRPGTRNCTEPSFRRPSMASSPSRFVRNDHLLASDVIDEEAIIIRLGDGTYYSLRGAGAAVWTGLAASPGLDDLVDAVMARFDVDRERARGTYRALPARLVAENLVTADPTPPAAPPRPVEPVARREPYAAPELEVHRDMAELLAIDPPTPDVLDHLLRRPGETDVKPSEGSRRA